MKRVRDAEALRGVIRDSGLSYRQLGRASRCSYNTLYLLLQGKVTSDDRAARIARTLGYLLIDELFVDAVSTSKQDDGKEEAVA